MLYKQGSRARIPTRSPLVFLASSLLPTQVTFIARGDVPLYVIMTATLYCTVLFLCCKVLCCTVLSRGAGDFHRAGGRAAVGDHDPGVHSPGGPRHASPHPAAHRGHRARRPPGARPLNAAGTMPSILYCTVLFCDARYCAVLYCHSAQAPRPGDSITVSFKPSCLTVSLALLLCLNGRIYVTPCTCPVLPCAPGGAAARAPWGRPEHCVSGCSQNSGAPLPPSGSARLLPPRLQVCPQCTALNRPSGGGTEQAQSLYRTVMY